MKRESYKWELPRTTIQLGARTAIMGILNVTPDSFSDGGKYLDLDHAVARAREIEQHGADILDIGGESSRPGSAAISEEEEIRRIMPVLEAVVHQLKIPVSVDTYRSRVARRAIDAGAQIVNDISGFRFDGEMPHVVKSTHAGVVLMHSRGSREALHSQPRMTDPLKEVRHDLALCTAAALDAGIPKAAVVIDPGIGFGKRSDESVLVLRNLQVLCPLQYPLLVGTSRKSFMRELVQDDPERKLFGTAATVAMAVFQGAHVVRVHDVRQMRAMVDIIDAIGEVHGM